MFVRYAEESKCERNVTRREWIGKDMHAEEKGNVVEGEKRRSI